MNGGTGLAGLAVTALVAAGVAIAATFLLASPAAPPAAAPGSSAASSGDLRAEVARLRAEVAELRGAKRPSPSASSPAAAPSEVPAGTAASKEGAADAPSAPLPATRGELDAIIDERIAKTLKGEGPALLAGGAEKKKVTIDEAGAALGLSAFEIDAVRRVYRDAENEMLSAIMGTTDLEAIRLEVAAAKDDPDKKAALVNKAVGNVFRNLGHVMTIEDRRDRELRKVLPEDKVKQLKDYELKPTFEDAELEGLLKDVFEN